MDFDLSEKHEAFRKVVRDFAEQEIGPHAERWDREHEFPVEEHTAGTFDAQLVAELVVAVGLREAGWQA
jgi:alkylation response protein AidB-like acyl-CoA dehydrogenase